MKNFAEFQILGRVGKIKEFDGKVNVTVCANYPTKKDGETRDNPHWNEVSIFAEAVRGYAQMLRQSGFMVNTTNAPVFNNYRSIYSMPPGP